MFGMPGHRVHRFGVIILPTAAIAALLISNITNPQQHVSGAAQEKPTATRQDWPIYGGDANGDRYSPLSQIDRKNVKQLHVAWRVDVGTEGGLQVNPLIVGRTMFVYTPSEQVMALDAASGKQMWTFDPGVKATQPSRGFSYWTNGKQSILFAGVMDHLYALDPNTGKPIPSFGESGSVDLRKDLGNEDFASNFAVLTTPGTIYKDMIIVGFRAPETHPAPHGDIRAYDVHTGKLRWSFHTIPHPGESGYETWPKDAWKTAGSANNWAGMVVDQERGIIFAPTGSAVDDFYGADRVGNDLYANTLLALDANTGKLIWHFQGVHHDIWDRDFPSPPVLVTVQRDGKSIDAVAQTSKQGFVYLFERTTGKPLFPLEEKSYPASTVPGEVASPTQSLPLVPAPFARQLLTADMLTNRTPEAHAWAVDQFSKFRSEGQFIPFSVGKETIIFPGYDGGAEWGGPAVDPHRAILYVNANDVAWTGSLAENQSGGPGFTLYQSQCAVCHGANRKGSPPQFPSLLGVSDRLSDSAIESLIHSGKGRMSAFPAIQGDSLRALIEYLHTEPGTEALAPSAERSDKVEAPSTGGHSGEALKYHFTGYKKFLDPDGYPAVAPPWGTLNAIDLNTGKYLWKIPFGQYPELAAKGMTQTGSENYGGPILTASGVLIISATNFDHKIRAYNSDTGELLWEADLPFAGNATPATYMVDGKQYVVIATSGARDKKSPQGAAYVAFALP
jgi:quinoprotein glucose dehydrogenase